MKENVTAREICRLLEKIEHERLPVLVEGKKDQRALEQLGVSKIQVLGRSLFGTVEVLERESKVVLLVDLDAEGKKLYAHLSKELQRRGVKIDNQLRRFLYRRTSLRHIEGLDTYLESLINHPHQKRKVKPGN